MSDERSIENVSRQRLLVPGAGLLEPDQTASNVEYSDEIRELEDAGVLKVKQQPKPRRRRASATTTPEED